MTYRAKALTVKLNLLTHSINQSLTHCSWLMVFLFWYFIYFVSETLYFLFPGQSPPITREVCAVQGECLNRLSMAMICLLTAPRAGPLSVITVGGRMPAPC